MKIRKIFIVSILLLLFNNVYAQETDVVKEKSWYVPDYVKAQFAGNIGLVSVGAGYQLFNDVLYSELLYGFVPEFASRADNIHLITIKNTFPIYRKVIGENLTITPIAGFTTTLDIGTNSFTTLPSLYPDGYYVPTAVHFTFFGGALLHKDFKKPKIFKGVDFYLEFGTVETYLWYAITSKEVGVLDVFSADVGVNFYF
ncbi:MULTISPECIES: hypothetical protein [unclassified Polaribacter]|uniref:hypothetical protein n=1 Tax=unclassified Polaribacter TaxID=196858 RepID=UPI001C4F60F2|nr:MULTISPECIES: hypothetical protein [unclassified Polaribacter]QXP62434.1 hypothetical protein H0I27_11105 [Polaribacter sp. HaHaR_3_91]QXP68184.1 hypothetical protein H0I28_06685 [Polaribacter sp. AHE13PA]